MQEKPKVRFVSLRKADTNQEVSLGQFKKQQQRQLNVLKSSANEYGQMIDSSKKECIEKKLTNKETIQNKFKNQERVTRPNQKMAMFQSPQSSKKIQSSKNIQQADVISFGIDSFFQSLDLLEKGMFWQFLQRLKEECKNTHKQGYQIISNVQNKLESMIETFVSVKKSLKCEDIDFSMSPDKSNKGQSFFGLVKDIIFKIMISFGQRLQIETKQVTSDLTKTQKSIDFIIKQVKSKLQQGNSAKNQLEHSKSHNQQLKKLIQALSNQNQIKLAQLSQKLSFQTQKNSSFNTNLNKILDQKMQIQKQLEKQKTTVHKLNDHIIKIQKEFTKQNQQLIYLKQQLENQKAVHLETVQKLNDHIKELQQQLEDQKLQFHNFQLQFENVQHLQEEFDDSQEDDTQENDNISSTEQSRIKSNKQTEKKAVKKTKKKNAIKPSGQTTKKPAQKTQTTTKKPIPKNSTSQKIPQKKSQIKTIKENGLKDTSTTRQLSNQIQSLKSKLQKQKNIKSRLQQEKQTIFYSGLLQSSYLIQYSDIETKSILSSIIKSSTGKMPLQYKLLYKFNRKVKDNFHDYIDHHKNLFLIIRLENGIIIGGFCPKPLKPSCNSPDGVIFTISSPQSFCSYQTKKNSDTSSCITYDDYYLIFGNSEIRITLHQDVVYSNFSTSKSYFDSKGHNVAYFLHGIPHKQVLTEQVSRQVKFKGFQCYQVVFDE